MENTILEDSILWTCVLIPMILYTKYNPVKITEVFFIKLTKLIYNYKNSKS